MENTVHPHHPNRTFLIIVGILILLIAAAALWYAFLSKNQNLPNGIFSFQKTASSSADANTSTDNQITWMQTENGWQSSTVPPACPSPVLQTPGDLTNVTSILYPGQTRGGDYKPHGGFRFDNAKNNNVTVTAPMDAVVVRGSRYLVNGETQYSFDFIAPCGIMYRLDHLLVLDPKYQKIAETLPTAVEGDSKTTNLSSQVLVKAGETIATSVGITNGGLNVFFDFGVYNLLTKNQISQDASWTANPAHATDLAQHAVCWFDLLPSTDAAKVRSFPTADSTSGKTSDYCK